MSQNNEEICSGCQFYNSGYGAPDCWDCYGHTKYKSNKQVAIATGIEAKVCEDIARRQVIGLNKYGVSVEENDLLLDVWLQHQYEELLDAAVYCKRAIEELHAQRFKDRK